VIPGGLMVKVKDLAREVIAFGAGGGQRESSGAESLVDFEISE